MGEINQKHVFIRAVICFYVVVRDSSSFPLLQPTVFNIPPQNCMPQNFPSPSLAAFRMAPKLMVRLKSALHHTPAGIQESTSNDQVFLENNGVDPSNVNSFNNIVNPNQDTVTIEQIMDQSQSQDQLIDYHQNQQQFPDQPINYPQNQQQLPEPITNYPQNQPQLPELPMNNAQNQPQFPDQLINYLQNQQQLQELQMNYLKNQPLFQQPINYPRTPQFRDQLMNFQKHPDGRFSIGQIIMAIPFLPFEVNVPDAIAWMYSGISSVIGSIGQRFPFGNQNPNEPRPNQMDLILGMNAVNGKPMSMPFRLLKLQMPMINMPADQNMQPPFMIGS